MPEQQPFARAAGYANIRLARLSRAVYNAAHYGDFYVLTLWIYCVGNLAEL